MTMTVSGTSGFTFPDNSTQATAATGFGFKNRIINGAMMIDQRNAGAEVNPVVSGSYYLDRWQATSTAASKFKIGQNAGSVTTPVGFTNYLGVTSLSAYTVGAAEVFSVQQRIEGLNVADLAWGTANAQTVTLSFWVRSSLTGTFGGALRNGSADRSYPYSYTISSANTWEQKFITISGDTTGTWLTTNGIGITVLIGLGVGSTYSGTAGSWAAGNYVAPTGATSVVGTNGATFYITGVQLEKGSTATSFDYRPYGQELALCQRYYQKFVGTGSGVQAALGSGTQPTTTNAYIYTKLTTTMRSLPTATISGLQITDATVYNTAGTLSSTGGGTDSVYLSVNMAANGAQFRPAFLIIPAGASGYADFSAEL